uniref:Uncharacterized protein n=1 Tax=Romanomermis culicivorax TaxID=13658 RepID=A0A915IIE1_ROMCU
MSIVSKISRTSLKSLNDLIKLRLIANKALDTEAVSNIDSIRSKTPGGDSDDDGDKSVASEAQARGSGKVKSQQSAAVPVVKLQTSAGTTIAQPQAPVVVLVVPLPAQSAMVQQAPALQPQISVEPEPFVVTIMQTVPGAQAAIAPKQKQRLHKIQASDSESTSEAEEGKILGPAGYTEEDKTYMEAKSQKKEIEAEVQSLIDEAAIKMSVIDVRLEKMQETSDEIAAQKKDPKLDDLSARHDALHTKIQEQKRLAQQELLC